MAEILRAIDKVQLIPDHPTTDADAAEDAVNNAIQRGIAKDYYYYNGDQAAMLHCQQLLLAITTINYNGDSYTDQYDYDEEAAAAQAAPEELLRVLCKSAAASRRQC
jgi:hypothetical protein